MRHPDGTPLYGLPDLRFVGLDATALGLEAPRMSFMETGEARLPALLCLHGIGGNSMGWRFVLGGLAERARVIAWNAPGYMLSDGFATAAPTPGQYAEAAVSLLEALGVNQPVHVLATSFGSMLAACLAARHPARVAKLVLLGASRGQRWKGRQERARLLAMREASVAGGGIALAEARSDALVAQGTPEEVRALVRGMVAATNPRGLMQAARCTDPVDVVEDFAPRIACPALCITGEADAVNPPEVGRAIAAAIPGGRFMALERTGHMAPIESPARTLALLRAFLFGEA